MRIFRLELVLGFVGAVGVASSAYARPFDHGTADRGDRDRSRPERPIQQHPDGTVPAHVMRGDIALHAGNSDGRGETQTDRASHERNHAWDTPDRDHPDGRLSAPEMPQLPIASAIRNRVEMRTDGDDPKAMSLRSNEGPQGAGDSQDGMKNTYRGPSGSAPVQIRSDIVLKCEGGEESLVNPSVKPDDQRGKRDRGHDLDRTRDSSQKRMGDASEASKLDPKTYGPMGGNMPSAVQVYMKASVKMHDKSNGGSGGDNDEK
jgi:hypothetical protein